MHAERKRSAARWLIPLALLAIIGAAAYYEYLRPISGARFASTDTAAAPTPVFPPGGPATTALPNPLEAPADGDPPRRAPTASQTPAVSPVTTTPAGAAPATIVLTWSGPSWVEIKDAAGASLLSQTGTAGSSQTISGAAPLEVTIGNASNVGLTFRRSAVDLVPHTRYNVARLSLK